MPPKTITALELYKFLKKLRIPNIEVKTTFKEQVEQIDFLLKNDKTGLVSTILDFMTHTATVPMKFESRNETLNDVLLFWQNKTLNRNLGKNVLDIPPGLRALSVQYFKERWRSSFLGLRVNWKTVTIDGESFEVPYQMWFLNGSTLSVRDNGALNTKTYFIQRKKDKIQLKNEANKSIIIRKPYSAWYENEPTPYLVQRGTLFNALFKNAITQKQSDVIEVIMPYMLQIKAGNDKLALNDMLPDEEEFKKLKEDIVNANEDWQVHRGLKNLIASLRYDVNLEHLIPDLTKLFNDIIIKPIDRNLLSSLGLIELEGFSSTRQEAILNPKVLIEEVTDAVLDWADLLEQVMGEFTERNTKAHRNLMKNTINVIPGTIKAFITDEMRTMLRSLYDRGLLSKQNAIEDIARLNFEVQFDRRTKENEQELDRTFVPPVIQNLEQFPNVDLQDENLEDQDKKPGTPEADNFNQAIIDTYLKSKKKNKKKYNAPFDTIDELPKDIKDVLPLPAQVLFLKVFNESMKNGDSEETAFKKAWGAVKKVYKKDPKKDKWIKKS